MTKQILNIDDIEYRAWERGDRFKAQLGAISSRFGARILKKWVYWQNFLQKGMEKQP